LKALLGESAFSCFQMTQPVQPPTPTFQPTTQLRECHALLSLLPQDDEIAFLTTLVCELPGRGSWLLWTRRPDIGGIEV